MVKKSEDGEIIIRAARTYLEPLGCKRKGRSRVWIADQRGWAIMIEFQPSGFSKGSYLNVAPSWLWYPKDRLTFDYGPVRFGRLISFKNAELFQPEAEALAEQAAKAVTHFREELGTPSEIISRLTEAAEEDTCWLAYHAAVANGLFGDADTSLRLFAQIINSESDVSWFGNFQNFCSELATKLSDLLAFRATILAIISRTRAQNNLPEDPNCMDVWYMHNG